MPAFSRDTRESLRSSRRNSLSQSAVRQRPRLLRSSATQPSITASNAIRAPMCSSSSPQKATDLLSRVVVYSPPPGHLEQASAPVPVPRQVEGMVICRDDHEQSSPTSGQDIVLVDSPSGASRCRRLRVRRVNAQSGYYFSFPSFDDWNQDKPEIEVEKDTDD